MGRMDLASSVPWQKRLKQWRDCDRSFCASREQSIRNTGQPSLFSECC